MDRIKVEGVFLFERMRESKFLGTIPVKLENIFEKGHNRGCRYVLVVWM